MRRQQIVSLAFIATLLSFSVEVSSQNKRLTPGKGLRPQMGYGNEEEDSEQSGGGGGSGISNNDGKTGLNTALNEVKLGDYVDLDDNLKNDIYGTIDFPNAELKDIVKAISQMAGKNFILDNKIQNKRVTILSPEPVTKQQAYNAFLSALYMNGLTLVSLGKFLKIVEARSALQSNVRVFTGDYAPASEEVVTVLYKLQFLNADEIQRFLQDLVPREGRITSYPNTNTLVMTDTGYNLRRVISIIKSIDVAGYEDQMESIPVRFASAKSLAGLIDEILEAQSGKGSSAAGGVRRGQPRKTRGGGVITKIVPDERTNALVILANGRGIQELKQLVATLDTPNAAAGGIHVYYCKNAVAEDLAGTINNLISQQKNTSPNARVNTNVPTIGGMPTSPSRDDSGGISIDGNIKVTADKATNSLVIVASGSDFSSLKQVIQKLDIPRRQVFVEATIMELAAGNNTKFGVVTNYGVQGAPRLGGFMPDTGPSVQNLLDPSTLTGVVAGFASGNSISVAGPNNTSVQIKSVTALLQALKNTNQAQVLNQPQILTSDNQQAELNITTKVATTTETVTASTGGSITTQNVNKEDVTISLKITPQISEQSDLVKLQVEQSLDNFTDSRAKGQIDVTKRKASTTVIVRDGDTVVVGGLQKDEASDNRSKIPLLGDLPIIGWLFKGKKSNYNKSNLVLFLTPHVINEYKDLIRITGIQIGEREKLGKKMYDPKDLLPDAVEDLKRKNIEDLKKPAPIGWVRNQKIDSPDVRNNPDKFASPNQQKILDEKKDLDATPPTELENKKEL